MAINFKNADGGLRVAGLGDEANQRVCVLSLVTHDSYLPVLLTIAIKVTQICASVISIKLDLCSC